MLCHFFSAKRHKQRQYVTHKNIHKVNKKRVENTKDFNPISREISNENNNLISIAENKENM